ncbi:transglutaminase TgpA family protein [Streptomyces sp. NPDC001443]
MSGRARLTVCAWAATLLAASALLPLVDSVGWMLEAAVLLAIQSGVGAAARRIPLPRTPTVLAQFLVTLVLLTLLFARQQSLGGLLPGPDTFRTFGALFRTGIEDVGRYAIPAPLSDGIRLMLVGGVLVIGLLVDTIAVTFRSAAPAGLPLLALYSVAAGISDGTADWFFFLLAAAGYLVLLLSESRERLSQWGRVFGGTPRTPGGESGPSAPVRTGRRIGAVSLGIALAVPLLPLPAIQGGLLDGARTGVGTGTGDGGTAAAVNPLVSLKDSLNAQKDRTVLVLSTNNPTLSDMYLRILSLDEFDGTTWKSSKRPDVAVPDELPTPVGLGADVIRAEITTRISAAGWYAQGWLPMPYPPSAVSVKGDWRYEPESMTLVGSHGQTTRGVTYEVKHLEVLPTADQLAAAPLAPESLRDEYTKVPDSLPSVVARTARTVTDGAVTDYAKAVKLQDYFAVEGGFRYDTEVKVGTGPNAIARFLKDKEGFCEHFSFAMAAMARTLGIPARVAVGFAPGTLQPDGSVSVGLKDAHAWPELYFQGVGWTRFEPTPTRGSAPSYTRPESSGSGTPDEPQASRSAGSAASDAPVVGPSCSAQDKKLQGCAAALPADSAEQGGGSGPWYRTVGWYLLGLTAVALPLLPMLWRLRRRSVRLGSARHAPSAAGAALSGGRERTGAQFTDELDVTALSPDGTVSRQAGVVATGQVLAAWRELTDTAWDYGIVPDDALTPRGAADRIVRLGHLEEPAVRSVHRVASAVEQVLFAPQPRAEPGLAEDVRVLRTALRSRASRTARLRAVLAPRSAVRAVWDLRDRWARMRGEWVVRWTEAVHRRRPSGEQSG